MAAVLLIPGRGGRYSSESFTSTAIAADTIDVSHCDHFLFQVLSTAGVAGTFAIEESDDGVSWTPLPSASAVPATNNVLYTSSATLGSVFALIRINPALLTGLDATHTLTVHILGGAVGTGLF